VVVLRDANHIHRSVGETMESLLRGEGDGVEERLSDLDNILVSAPSCIDVRARGLAMYIDDHTIDHPHDAQSIVSWGERQVVLAATAPH
jgi:hypothetical protein